MKFLHTADWHLGRVFASTGLSALPIQKEVLEEIVNIADREDVDLILIAGDVFDTYNPPAQAEKLFYETLKALAKPERIVIVIAGNHDSPERLTSVLPLLQETNIFMFGTPASVGEDTKEFENEFIKVNPNDKWLIINFKNKEETLAILPFPYASELRLRRAFSATTPKERAYEYGELVKDFLNGDIPDADYKMVVSHIFVRGGTLSGSERSLTLGGSYLVPREYLPDVDYIALGHLHSYQKLGENIYYSGSVIPLSMDEMKNYDGKSVIIGDEEGIKKITLKTSQRFKLVEGNGVDEILEYEVGEDDYVFVRMRLKSALTALEIQKIREKFPNLVAQEVQIDHILKESAEPLNLFSETPEEIFRSFYNEMKGKEPAPELVKLFLKYYEEVAKNEASIS